MPTENLHPYIGVEIFLSNPTDIAAASVQFETLRGLAHLALRNGDDAVYWNMTQSMKLVGKFLPASDSRNPDNLSYTTRQQG